MTQKGEIIRIFVCDEEIIIANPKCREKRSKWGKKMKKATLREHRRKRPTER